MIESKVWGKFQRDLGNTFFMERLENHIVPGFPDVYIENLKTRNGGFVELKSRDTGHWISRHQALWLRRYRALGGRCAIITGSADDFFWYYRVDTTYDWVEAILSKRVSPVEFHNFADNFNDLWLIL